MAIRWVVRTHRGECWGGGEGEVGVRIRVGARMRVGVGARVRMRVWVRVRIVVKARRGVRIGVRVRIGGKAGGRVGVGSELGSKAREEVWSEGEEWALAVGVTPFPYRRQGAYDKSHQSDKAWQQVARLLDFKTEASVSKPQRIICFSKARTATTGTSLNKEKKKSNKEK